MARGKKEEAKAAGAPAWMMTYGDMMTLLLTFFVLIVSFSSIQEVGFKKALGSLRGALGVLQPDQERFILKNVIPPNNIYAFLANKLRQTTGDISEDLNFIEAIEGAKIEYDDKGIRIILPSSILFGTGEAELSNDARTVLKKIGAFLFENRSSIAIEGHTDNTPVSSGKFASNWELSVARSMSVMQFLYEVAGLPYQQMSIAGYGEYNPVASNDTEEGREKNRRVEIIILAQQKPKSYILR